MSNSDEESLRSLLRFGLARAIQAHSETVRARAPRIQLELDLIDDENLLPEAANRELFHVYQEALRNIEQHAEEHPAAVPGSPVRVRVYLQEGTLALEVRDDGKCFSIPADWVRFAQGRGVMGMKPRIEALGGDLQVTSEPGPGVVIEARVPLPRA
jgi:two-component system, NarL family, sensor histidine kinase UhpB